MKKTFKLIWKYLWAALFCFGLVIGIFMLLDVYGTYRNKLSFGPDNQNFQMFIGWILVVVGLIFGFLPFFRIAKWILKMIWAIAFTLVFIVGVCMALDYYVESIHIAFVHAPNVGGWLSITLIIAGALLGVLPFLFGIKKAYKKLKKES